MTKLEILEALESLKDFVNSTCKPILDALKVAVMKLEEPAPPKEPKVEEKPKSAKAKPKTKSKKH